MKVSIHATPQLAIEDVPLETVHLLVKCATLHYDGLCKSFGREGGLLYGWQNQLQWARNYGGGERADLVGTGMLHATMHQANVLMKICENTSPLQPSERAAVHDFSATLRRAFQKVQGMDIFVRALA